MRCPTCNRTRCGHADAAERLAPYYEGWPNVHTGRGVVLVDFDGVLYPSWALYDLEASPLALARPGMRRLKGAGYRLVIFTSRLSLYWARDVGRGTIGEHKFIDLWLHRWSIPFDVITAEKQPAELYIDDRALQAEPEYPGLVWSKARLRLGA